MGKVRAEVVDDSVDCDIIPEEVEVGLNDDYIATVQVDEELNVEIEKCP